MPRSIIRLVCLVWIALFAGCGEKNVDATQLLVRVHGDYLKTDRLDISVEWLAEGELQNAMRKKTESLSGDQATLPLSFAVRPWHGQLDKSARIAVTLTGKGDSKPRAEATAIAAFREHELVTVDMMLHPPSLDDACSAGTPAANDSSCDGVDNDCDGATDEDFVSTATSCGIGACAAAGASSCMAGSVQTNCSAGTPAANDANCDGVDNDCDGATDEDFVLTATPCGIGPCDVLPAAQRLVDDDGIVCECPAGYAGPGVGDQGCVPQLASLSVEPGALEPAFDPSLTSYDVLLAPWHSQISWSAVGPPDSVLVAQGSALTMQATPAHGEQGVLSLSAGGATSDTILTFRRVSRQQYLKPKYPGPDLFGYAVALDGDRLAASSPLEGSDGTSAANNSVPGAGAVHVFERQTDGAWREAAYVKPYPIVSRFGWSLALQGETLAVGAKWADVTLEGGTTLQSAGTAYVFQRDSRGRWVQSAKLEAPNPNASDQFGKSIDLDGDLLAVGAESEDGNGSTLSDNSVSNAGAVYLYRRSPEGVWNLEAYLKSQFPSASDTFGYEVSVSGNRVVVGSLREDSDGTSEANEDATDSGAAYVFVRTAEGRWVQEAYLKPRVVAKEQLFGTDVAILGERIVIGAMGDRSGPIEGVGGMANAGAVYVFELLSGAWEQVAFLKPSLIGVNEYFGRSVDAEDDLIVIGAHEAGTEMSNRGGAAYVFRRSESGLWTEQAVLRANLPTPNDVFGHDVTISKGRVAVGAPEEDGSGAPGDNEDTQGAGAAYLFE